MDATAQDLEHAAAIFVEARPRLLEIANRILDSKDESEDVVQEAWLRWQATDRSVVVNSTGFLVTTTARLALNVVQSARSRHEIYADPTLLDREDPSTGPQGRVERDDAVERAMVLLLENLGAAQRASFILHEVFDYPYEQIATIVQLTPVNVRQVVRRSFLRIAAQRHRPVAPDAHRRLVQAFRAAADAGNVSALERVFAADIAA
jgi:RNA polymerase sigma-70 factor, ECF subfamily